MNSSRRDIGFVITASCIYAAITLDMVLRHVPWRDEADVWLASRDLSLHQLWPWLHHVGSPGLWYLMVMPLAKLGAPYLCMNLLNWVMGVAAAVVILSLAPFPKLVRLILVFSFYLPAEYTVVARDYATMFLLLVLIAWLYRQRYQRPVALAILILLLANVGPHGTLFAAALTCGWGLDALSKRRLSGRVLIAGMIACGGVLLAVAQVLPSPADGQLAGALSLRHPDAIDYILSHTFCPHYPMNDGHILSFLRRRYYPVFVLAWLSPRLITCAFLCGTLYLLRRSPSLLITYIFAFLGIAYVFMFKFFGGDHHTGLLWLFTWVMLWIVRSEPPDEDAAVWKWGVIPFALSSIWCVALTIDLVFSTTVYSGSKAAAEFLLTHHLADRPIGMYEENRCESLLPYLGKKKAWYAGEDRYGTYMSWNARFEKDRENIPAAIARMLNKSAANPNMVLVFNTDLHHALPKEYRLVFDNRNVPTVIYDERYAIYVRR